jgi:hypothetical protein
MVVSGEPKLNRALLGCCEAPLKNGSHETTLPRNGIHCADRHQMHRLSLAYGSIFTRVAYQFSLFGWYLVGISQFLPNQYRRKTWLAHFGIIILAGTPFFLKRGVMAPFSRGPAPILRKKGFPPHLKGFPPNSLALKIPTKIPTNQYTSTTVSKLIDFFPFSKKIPG